jgi:methylated-DNA-[protein]-cysteine S-methyltransferase
MEYHVFETDGGWVAVLGSARGLVSLNLPCETAQQALDELSGDISQAVQSPGRFGDLTQRLQRYFSGEKVDFPDELDLSAATPFQKAVWQAARRIEYGQTRSYGWLATQAGKPGAARAVGQAMAKNPLPIIVPCHRVIGSGGGLGGFSGGLEIKEYLLRLEATATSHQR